MSRVERDRFFLSLARWGFFVLVLALVPIGANALDALTRDDPRFHFEALFERGELLLVASAVMGGALAEMFVHAGAKLRALRLTAGASAGAMIVATSIWFAEIASASRDHQHLNHHGIAVGSLWLFGVSCFVGLACLFLTAISE